MRIRPGYLTMIRAGEVSARSAVHRFEVVTAWAEWSALRIRAGAISLQKRLGLRCRQKC